MVQRQGNQSRIGIGVVEQLVAERCQERVAHER
jgi:hypothetical protein